MLEIPAYRGRYSTRRISRSLHQVPVVKTSRRLGQIAVEGTPFSGPCSDSEYSSAHLAGDPRCVFAHSSRTVNSSRAPTKNIPHRPSRPPMMRRIEVFWFKQSLTPPSAPVALSPSPKVMETARHPRDDILFPTTFFRISLVSVPSPLPLSFFWPICLFVFFFFDFQCTPLRSDAPLSDQSSLGTWQRHGTWFETFDRRSRSLPTAIPDALTKSLPPNMRGRRERESPRVRTREGKPHAGPLSHLKEMCAHGKAGCCRAT